MGIDTYGAFQRKRGQGWFDVSSNFSGRRDWLWHWLGGGDDSYGRFRMEPLIPLRGLPTDLALIQDCMFKVTDIHALSDREREQMPTDPMNEEYMARYIGEHGFSWVLGSEVLGAPSPRVTYCFVMPLVAYQQWDGRCEPASGYLHWEGHAGPSHDKVELIGVDWLSRKTQSKYAHIALPGQITAETTHVAVEWTYDVTQDLSYFLDEVRRLTAVHGEIRFLIGRA